MNEISEELEPSLKEWQRIFLQQEGQSIFNTDERILCNILFNLLSNASKYSPINKCIYLKWTNLGNQLIISIRDEGMGIPINETKYLFERFFRASNV